MYGAAFNEKGILTQQKAETLEEIKKFRAVPFGTALFICTQKTAPPTRCCNYTIHFSAFRRSGFLSDIYIISDLYKTVSVNLSDFLLRRTTVDAAQFGHLTVVIVFV